VARYKSTTRQQLAASRESLEAVNARILGIVLNQVRDRAGVYYGPLTAVAATSPPQTSPTNKQQILGLLGRRPTADQKTVTILKFKKPPREVQNVSLKH
jgi:Mrp family chromosome partitioning ATPase